jgi:hypothetical protein
MSDHDKARDWLTKKARRRSRRYPIATIAYYGPDDRRATKVVVGILLKRDEIAAMKKWFSDEADVRHSAAINQQIVEFLDVMRVESVVMPERIIGCPHEEGIDYPDGGSCPHCPFWKGKDRWTGLSVN